VSAKIPTPPIVPPDATFAAYCAYLGISERQGYRLLTPVDGEPPVIESYLLGDGARRIPWEAIHAYRDACRAKGPQLNLTPVSEKRGVGRPRKHLKPEPVAAE
jgi:hypothetical protein